MYNNEKQLAYHPGLTGPHFRSLRVTQPQLDPTAFGPDLIHHRGAVGYTPGPPMGWRTVRRIRNGLAESCRMLTITESGQMILLVLATNQKYSSIPGIFCRHVVSETVPPGVFFFNFWEWSPRSVGIASHLSNFCKERFLTDLVNELTLIDRVLRSSCKCLVSPMMGIYIYIVYIYVYVGQISADQFHPDHCACAGETQAR